MINNLCVYWKDNVYDTPDYDAYVYNDYVSSEDEVRQDNSDEEYGNYGDYEDYANVDTGDQICCEHKDILPTVIKERDILSCEEKAGFKCVPQDVSIYTKV